MRVEPNGYWFRQSWFGDFMLCPERARIAAFHPDQLDDQLEDGTDATVTGSACHAGIEHFLRGGFWQESVEVAHQYLQERIDGGTFRYVKVKNPKLLHRDVGSCLDGWIEDIFPQVGEPHADMGIEHKFEHRISGNIWLEGTWDFLDEYLLLWDWKTAGSNYYLNYGPKAIEKKHQPTFYTAVVAEWNQGATSTVTSLPWKYGIMIKGPKAQGVIKPAVRTVDDWEWLVHQLEAVVSLYEHLGPDAQWPLHDNEWHCSPEWCDNWTNCKGSFVSITRK